ncbi:Na+/H+ antiporter NhaC [Dellaglioa algida]|uniref:Na+ H+ antiporter NhaC n=1 Tax=Dellaglioa algida DSM 15638 TaxID=1423719 RepID=A0A0R1HRY3_9LACO|nr:Na+/H+ antiporter NhaC [Dellaglioa algida]KRK45978.1 Na+ H+ antiporter NhaC [Dellaglioa algida DSM 15638]MDK1732778.1 Na+/H+ antiporter NhaC [Dellaglioa algida]MDK1734302.1 Na+/H+ antiporter NhaC [Dellaglioa algida]
MKNKLSFTEAASVLMGMLIIMGFGVIKFGLSPQTPVMLVIGLLILWARIRHFSWEEVHAGIKDGMSTGLIPIFIFILIGSLIATWIAAGIIPTLMIWGFNLISVKFFVPSVFVVCAIIGLSIGSAFTLISTVGIALFGMGMTMGVNPALVAGAIISGAIFGDKMSPLSDSTNLAAAIGESDLFKHIKNMMWTTIPAFVVSLILYFILGSGSSEANMDKISQTISILSSHFSITAWAALPIILMFVCAWLKIPAIPTLFINIGVSLVMLFIQKPHTSLQSIAALIQSGFVSKTGNANVDMLLTRGGVSSMMGTVSLIILTLTLGGLLMNFNIIQVVMEPLVKRLNSSGKLITATIFAGIGVNLFVGEQYLSVILPGKAFKPAFDKSKLDNLALSRALEDGGTVINYLIPWGVAGAFAASTLGVPTLDYLPFVFFSLLSPVFSIISGWTGIGLKEEKA